MTDAEAIHLGAAMLDAFVFRALNRAAIGIDVTDMPRWAKDRAWRIRARLRRRG
jgi:hypothetical protein